MTTSCVTSDEYTTPSYVDSNSPTIPGYTSCVDACWYTAYHVTACHRLKYIGENSTSIAMVSGHYRIAGDDRYYNLDTREFGIWRAAEQIEIDNRRYWNYTTVQYVGDSTFQYDSKPTLRFGEEVTSVSSKETGCSWIAWECPFDKRSPITGIQSFGTLAGSDIGLLENSGSLLINPYGPYGEFWEGG